MLCAFVSDLIVVKSQCEECLCGKVQMRIGEGDEERMRVTVLFLNASARYCAPRAPI